MTTEFLERRVSQLLEGTVRVFDEGNPDAAAHLVGQAYSLALEDPNVARMFRAYGQVGDPSAIFIPDESAQEPAGPGGRQQLRPDQSTQPDEPGTAGVVLNVSRDVPILTTSRDSLGYARYASALARFLSHPDTLPPLTISIQAPWGAGKSSLMRMIRFELDPDATQHRPYSA